MEFRIRKSSLKIVSIGLLALISSGCLFYFQILTVPQLATNPSFSNLLAVFFTGLFTGGLTCVAVQGGLLTATIAQREEQKLKEASIQGKNVLPVLVFLLAKLVSYTLLGLVLGWIGSVFQLSLTFKTVLQFLVGCYMLIVAGNLLSRHPFFRYFLLQPPRFLTKLLRKQTKRADFFAPGVLGALTIFIPCGTTQAMMALAVASGKPLLGAAIMGTFTIGTSPVFFLLGYVTTRMQAAQKEVFARITALGIIGFAVITLNGALALTGSHFTLYTLRSSLTCTFTQCPESQTIAPTAARNITIRIDNNGYSPNLLNVKKGTRITLHLANVGSNNCSQAFTIPSLGIQKIVALGSSATVTFTAPAKPTELTFMCSQGLHPGVIEVM